MAYHNAREYDETLSDFGWVPGDYIQICKTCLKSHLAAPRSINCESCAQKAKLAKTTKPKIVGKLK